MQLRSLTSGPATHAAKMAGAAGALIERNLQHTPQRTVLFWPGIRQP